MMSPQELLAASATRRLPAWQRGGVITGEVVQVRKAARISASVGKPVPFKDGASDGFWNAAGAALVLYGTFIGIPAAGGIWAAFKIWRMTRHGW
jgi:hypothetical protein